MFQAWLQTQYQTPQYQYQTLQYQTLQYQTPVPQYQSPLPQYQIPVPHLSVKSVNEIVMFILDFVLLAFDCSSSIFSCLTTQVLISFGAAKLDSYSSPMLSGKIKELSTGIRTITNRHQVYKYIERKVFVEMPEWVFGTGMDIQEASPKAVIFFQKHRFSFSAQEIKYVYRRMQGDHNSFVKISGFCGKNMSDYHGNLLNQQYGDYASNCSPSVKISKEAIDAIASCPMYSSNSSLPKSIANMAAGSMIASL
ncbi:hypothetical protein LXL04_022201 [Taraxacum kok-saghyz]